MTPQATVAQQLSTATATSCNEVVEEKEVTSEVSEEKRLEELYQAAKDENELLEFKNYELLFKIQELEQNQRKIQNKLDGVAARTPEEAGGVAGQSGGVAQVSQSRS